MFAFFINSFLKKTKITIYTKHQKLSFFFIFIFFVFVKSTQSLQINSQEIDQPVTVYITEEKETPTNSYVGTEFQSNSVSADSSFLFQGIQLDQTNNLLNSFVPDTKSPFSEFCISKVDTLFKFSKDNSKVVLISLLSFVTIALTTPYFTSQKSISGSNSSTASLESSDNEGSESSYSGGRRRRSFKGGFNSLMEGIGGIGSRVNSATKSVFNSGFSNYSSAAFVPGASDPEFKAQIKNAFQIGGNVGGLINDGNTCFMNSVLQSLASSNEFMDFLNEYANSALTEMPSENGKLLGATQVPFSQALDSLLEKLNSKHGNKTPAYKTKGLLKVMTDSPSKNLFLGYQQEDAQEFYQSVMKQIEKEYTIISNQYKEIKANNKKTDQEKFVDWNENMLQGLQNLGQTGDIFVPAVQVDPSYPDAEKKVLPLKLITPVDGLQCERIGCMNCGETGGMRYSVISGLGLSLPANNLPSHDLTELLDDWINPEVIDGVECNRCGLNEMINRLKEQIAILQQEDPNNEKEKTQKIINLSESRIKEIEQELTKPVINDEIYKKLRSKNVVHKSKKTKQIYFARPPPLLCIHINRSVFDPRTYSVRKNNSQVIFPMKLDLTDYVAEPSDINMDARYSFRKQDFDEENEPETTEKTEIETEKNEVEEETHTAEEATTKSMDSEDPEQSAEKTENAEVKTEMVCNELTYSLKSVISHFGTHNYGHYIAYRKYRGIWWRISDETVRVTSEREVLNCQGTFMLFYELSFRNDPRDEYQLDKEAIDEEIEIITNGDAEISVGEEGIIKDDENQDGDLELSSAAESDDESSAMTASLTSEMDVEPGTESTEYLEAVVNPDEEKVQEQIASVQANI